MTTIKGDAAKTAEEPEDGGGRRRMPQREPDHDGKLTLAEILELLRRRTAPDAVHRVRRQLGGAARRRRSASS